MKIIDLTHTIAENMPVYPGTEGPKLEMANTYEKDGFKETLLTMYSHTGTHMDAPAHIFPDKKTLDEMEVEHFVGKALVIDCKDLGEGERIPLDLIDKAKADKAQFLLFNLGWDKRWGEERYFGDYPYPSQELIQYIIETEKKGVGLDVIGIDPIADENLTIHRKLFKNNEIVVIENLKNLEKVGKDLFLFFALPMKFHGADGAPVRAFGLIEEVMD